MSRPRSTAVRFNDLRLRLLKLAVEDQKARTLGASTSNDPAFYSQLTDGDRQRAEELLSVLRVIKTPSVRNVGYDGSFAVWLIAHHNADYKNLGETVLRKMLYLYRKDKSQVYYKGIPFLIDRLMIIKQTYSGVDATKTDEIHNHVKQMYGTQFRVNRKGELVRFKVINPEGLQSRREKFGLSADD